MTEARSCIHNPQGIECGQCSYERTDLVEDIARPILAAEHHRLSSEDHDDGADAMAEWTEAEKRFAFGDR